MSEVNIGVITVSLTDYPTGPGHNHGGANLAVLTQEDLGKQTDLPVALPSLVPDGFNFIDAARLTSPREVIAITYEGKHAFFVMVKSLVSAVGGRLPVVGDGISESKVGDRPAALVAASSRSGPAPAYLTLVWQNGAVVEQLIGHGLTIEQLQEVAASIPTTA